MAKLFIQLMVVSTALFIVACDSASKDNKSSDTANAKDSAQFDLAKAKSAIETENAKFIEAFKKGDSAGVASNYAGDAWVLPPNSTSVKGNEILSLWGSFIRSGVKDLKLSTDDITGSAEQLAETGNYELYGDKNKLLDKGKYVVVWKPQNGNWKMYRDIWNSSMPAEPAK
jgi:ketosteroid isomerase-like protein